MELTALDVRYAARELAALRGARVQKIVQSDTEKRDVLLTLYVPGREEGKIHLRFLLPGLVCTHEEKPDRYPQIPPGFAMFLRKYVGGARLISATQQGFDRILRIELEGKLGRWSLVVELIPPGNMILLGEDGKIKNLLENQHYKDRSLRGGLLYTQPPAAFDTPNATDGQIADRIKEATRTSLAAALATSLGLGGAYAEEACSRAGIDKSTTTLDDEMLRSLVRAVREILELDIAPHKDGARVYPFKLVGRPSEPCTTASFLAALGADVPDTGGGAPRAAAVAKPKANKLQTMLDAQEANLVSLREIAVEEQRKADRVYSEYALIKEVIDTAQNARSRKEDVAHALKRFSQVKRYDNATAIVELDVEDDA